MKAFVGVTDFDWYIYLSTIQDLDEVNFWQPSVSSQFKALQPSEPFLFKLHSPRDFIVGGGFYAHYSRLPVSLAWDAFQEKNGANSLPEMRKRIEKYRRSNPSIEDYQIGCILLEKPFFFKREKWIPAPKDWSPNIVRGKGYDTTFGEGMRVWDTVKLCLQAVSIPMIEEERRRYGEPFLVTPRLGQGSFRIIVTDAYSRRCAVTDERTLPALDAVHIKPYVENGPHDVQNGILFRSDIHKLFDNGYVTVTGDYRFEVSRRIKEEFENGRDYYALHGRALSLPSDRMLRPDSSYIQWHNSMVYRG
jgi:putative restriction endonuclease